MTNRIRAILGRIRRDGTSLELDSLQLSRVRVMALEPFLQGPWSHCSTHESGKFTVSNSSVSLEIGQTTNLNGFDQELSEHERYPKCQICGKSTDHTDLCTRSPRKLCVALKFNTGTSLNQPEPAPLLKQVCNSSWTISSQKR